MVLLFIKKCADWVEYLLYSTDARTLDLLSNEVLELLLNRAFIRKSIEDGSYLKLNEMQGQGVYQILK